MTNCRVCRRLVVLAVVSLITASMVFPAPVRADGGPMVDPQLFARLKEGQQVAVITLQDMNTVSVDLFISILDQTDESHEVVFFVPLGVQAHGFDVREQSSLDFNDSLTRGLDMALFQDYRRDQEFMQSLFAGALLTNGVWLTPLWLPFLLSGCAEAPPPVSTFQTDSSEVNVFDIDEATDLEALISTTGLDPSVTETLSRLKGQQIAVVKLRTQPHQKTTVATTPDESGGEPGLHFSWITTLTPTVSGATYVYPLGTGTAWAHPIEMTRVYIVVPLELDFTVQYPELGVDRSGFTKKQWTYEPRIADASQGAAYAVDTATDQSIYYHERRNIWRVTYTNSNSAEDILITVKEGSGISLGLMLRQAGPGLTLLIGLLVAALFWILAWYFLMPHLLRRDSRDKKLRWFSLTYIGWNALLFLPGAVLYFIFSFGAQALALSVMALLFGGVSVLIFSLRHLRKMDVSIYEAIRAFIIITLVSNGAYLLFVLGYARLVSAI